MGIRHSNQTWDPWGRGMGHPHIPFFHALKPPHSTEEEYWGETSIFLHKHWPEEVWGMASPGLNEAHFGNSLGVSHKCASPGSVSQRVLFPSLPCNTHLVSNYYSISESFQVLFFFQLCNLFFLFGCTLKNLPVQGLNPSPLQWKCRVLTIGPLGKSNVNLFTLIPRLSLD